MANWTRSPLRTSGRALGCQLPVGAARVGRRFRQYSSTGSVSGISGNVDLDVYNGTLAELRGSGGWRAKRPSLRRVSSSVKDEHISYRKLFVRWS